MSAELMDRLGALCERLDKLLAALERLSQPSITTRPAPGGIGLRYGVRAQPVYGVRIERKGEQ